MYFINLILEKIEQYAFAVHHYNTTREWNFDQAVQLQHKTVNLFSSSLNYALNQCTKNTDELCFLAFHANRFNPTENNLLTLFFEICDRIKYKEFEILLVNYLYKPHLISDLHFTGISLESIFSPVHVFHSDLLLIDAQKEHPKMEKLALQNLDLKILLKKEMEKIVLFHFYEKLLQKQGLTERFIRHLLHENELDNKLLAENPRHFSCIARQRASDFNADFNKQIISDLQATLNTMYARVEYYASNEVMKLGLSDLVLAPVVNEIYLKCQEYFVDAEFPFIAEELLKNIRRNNPEVLSKTNKYFL